MSSYTITIQADDAKAETKVTVDDSGGRPRVTEVSVRATSSAGLSAEQLSSIDPDLLLRAVAPRAAAKATSATSSASAAAPRKAGKKAARGRAAKAGTKAAGAKATRAKATRAKAAGRRAKRTSASASGGTGSRIYRRTPDDLAATFASVGSISAVARHYGVPRHTAQGWIARLRRG
jgi:hypothetical protein